ncbi:MAG: 30S ribosomal protein S9 [Bacteroidota bacterium]|nr:30S ribosomal protein S9 [Bacteroidota bacterium]
MQNTHAIGRRKASIARVFLSKGEGNIIVNKQKLDEYFSLKSLQSTVCKPLDVLNLSKDFDIQVSVYGGGNTGQADAIKLAIARALCKIDEANKPSLKSNGLLTRDSRVVERKKPGQKKARKKFQWVKR